MNKILVLGAVLVAFTLSLAGAQMARGGIRSDGYLYRGQDMNVLRAIRMNDRATFPTAGYDFYQGRATTRTRTPYRPNQGMADTVEQQKQEADRLSDPVAKAMTLTRNLEARICDAKEDLSIVDDAPCKTNDDCDLICRDYAGKQEEVVSAFYCDPRGNTCGCCSPQAQSGGRADSFGEPSFGGSPSVGSNSAPGSGSDFGSSSFGPSSDSGFGSSGSSFGPSSDSGFGSSSQPFGNSFANEGSSMGSNLMAQPPNMNSNVPSNMMPPAGFGPSDQGMGGNMPAGGNMAGGANMGNAMPYDPNSYNQPNYYPEDASGYAAY